MQLETRHLRAVCAIAEAGSLSKAATQLGMSQPALTAALQRIERTLGGTLFSRSAHGVDATELGKFVVARARAVLADLDALSATSIRLAMGQGMASLRFGGVPGNPTTAFVNRLATLLPDTDTVVHVEQSSRLLVQLLAQDRLDVILVEEYPTAPLDLPSGAEHRTLVDHEPQLVALADTHRLAERTMIRLAELADEWWVIDPTDDTGTVAYLRTACETAGFTARFRHYVSDATAARDLVAGGQAVALCQATTRQTSGIALHRLAGDPLVRRLLLVCARDRAAPERVDALHRAAAAAYADAVRNNPTCLRWWEANPELAAGSAPDPRDGSAHESSPDPAVGS